MAAKKKTKGGTKATSLTLGDVLGLKQGEGITWTSQAAGSMTSKAGTVVCHVPRGENFREVAKRAGVEIAHRQKTNGELVSKRADRVLVQVVTKGKRSNSVSYYLPPVHRLVRRGKNLTAAQVVRLPKAG